MYKDGTCNLAHSFDDLLPPKEHTMEYKDVWRGGVDRWYGQEMPGQHLARIKMYHDDVHPCEIPVWVAGLKWFYMGMEPEAYGHQPWDFDLFQEVHALQRYSISTDVPFKWARRLDHVPHDLWDALYARQARLHQRDELLKERMEALRRARQFSEPDGHMDTATRMQEQPEVPMLYEEEV